MMFYDAPSTVRKKIMSSDTSRISITAHYTGYVWYKNGLSTAAFTTPVGRLAYYGLLPGDSLARKLIGSDLETQLLQRHLIIDHLLEQAIEQHGKIQVLELACGLSPRGHRFTHHYGAAQLKYVEADLPAMARRKTALLSRVESLSQQHYVRPCNILATEGAESLEALIENEFDQGFPLIVITEGLVNYFPYDLVSPFWARLSQSLKPFTYGAYLTDMLSDDKQHNNSQWLNLGMQLLSVAARGKTALHFNGDDDMKQGLQALGFHKVLVHEPTKYYAKLSIPVSKAAPSIRVVECV